MRGIVIIRKIVFCIVVIFLITALFSLTIGQKLPIEFADWRMMHRYYDFIYQYLPISFILTLTGTIKNNYSFSKNWTIVSFTLLTSVISFFIFSTMIFNIGFGAWTNEFIYYKNKNKPDITINEQVYDVGALGYGGRRTVQLKPILKYWNIVNEVDISTLKNEDWILVKSEVYLQ